MMGPRIKFSIYLFSSVALFRFSSVVVGSPISCEMTIPGLAL